MNLNLDVCLICDKYEKHHPDADFICSACVQDLLQLNRNEIRRAYHLAVEQGLTRKIKALEIWSGKGFRNGIESRNINRGIGQCFYKSRYDGQIRSISGAGSKNKKKRSAVYKARTK